MQATFSECKLCHSISLVTSKATVAFSAMTGGLPLTSSTRGNTHTPRRQCRLTQADHLLPCCSSSEDGEKEMKSAPPQRLTCTQLTSRLSSPPRTCQTWTCRRPSRLPTPSSDQNPPSASWPGRKKQNKTQANKTNLVTVYYTYIFTNEVNSVLMLLDVCYRNTSQDRLSCFFLLNASHFHPCIICRILRLWSRHFSFLLSTVPD